MPDKPMPNRCLDCHVEFEQGSRCPNCDSTNVVVQLAAASRSGSSARATLVVIQYWDRLLQTAEELYKSGCNAADLHKPGFFGAAIIVAQTACEVVVEAAVAKAFQVKNSPELWPWIEKTIQSYSLKNDRTRGLYEILTGDANINKQPFWPPYSAMVDHRNDAGHGGPPVTENNARAAIEVAKGVVNHVLTHNSLP